MKLTLKALLALGAIAALPASAMADENIISLTGGDGKVAVMPNVAGVGSEVGRLGGFVEQIKANSKIGIVGPFYSQSQMATALNQTTDALAAKPDLKGLPRT